MATPDHCPKRNKHYQNNNEVTCPVINQKQHKHQQEIDDLKTPLKD